MSMMSHRFTLIYGSTIDSQSESGKSSGSKLPIDLIVVEIVFVFNFTFTSWPTVKVFGWTDAW